MSGDKDISLLRAHRHAHFRNLEILEPNKRIKPPDTNYTYQQVIR